MILRNATIFQFPVSLRETFDNLDAYLTDMRLKPVGPMEMSASGFVSPFGEDHEQDAVETDAQEPAQQKALHHRIGDTIWLTVASDIKQIPSHVINRKLAKAIKDYEIQNGRAPGSSMRKQIKQELIEAQVPDAPIRSTRMNVLVDLAKGLCVADTASKKAAESAVSLIRQAIGSFPALPINASVDPRSVMTGWIAGEQLPEGVTLGDECELKEPTEHGAIIRCKRQDLSADDVTGMIESGKKVTRLAQSYESNLSFTLCDDLVIRNIKLLDGAIDELEATEREDINAELDAKFALMRGEFLRLWEMKQSAFKISELAV